MKKSREEIFHLFFTYFLLLCFCGSPPEVVGLSSQFQSVSQWKCIICKSLWNLTQLKEGAIQQPV